MCGIAGIWDFNNGTSGDLLAKEVNDMAKTEVTVTSGVKKWYINLFLSVLLDLWDAN